METVSFSAVRRGGGGDQKKMIKKKVLVFYSFKATFRHKNGGFLKINEVGCTINPKKNRFLLATKFKGEFLTIWVGDFRRLSEGAWLSIKILRFSSLFSCFVFLTYEENMSRPLVFQS